MFWRNNPYGLQAVYNWSSVLKFIDLFMQSDILKKYQVAWLSRCIKSDYLGHLEFLLACTEIPCLFKFTHM